MSVPIGPVTFHPLREQDIGLFHAWRLRPHVAEWWGDDDASLDVFRAKYLPRGLASQGVSPYIARAGGQPIGWAQSYVALGAGEGWWEDETDPGARGIDQFLCEPDWLGQGLGTRMVSAFVERLFSDPTVTHIQTDPSPRNLRAIRCYEKCSFRALRSIVTPDGPAILMVQDRPAHEGRVRPGQPS